MWQFTFHLNHKSNVHMLVSGLLRKCLDTCTTLASSFLMVSTIKKGDKQKHANPHDCVENYQNLEGFYVWQMQHIHSLGNITDLAIHGF